MILQSPRQQGLHGSHTLSYPRQKDARQRENSWEIKYTVDEHLERATGELDGVNPPKPSHTSTCAVDKIACAFAAQERGKRNLR